MPGKGSPGDRTEAWWARAKGMFGMPPTLIPSTGAGPSMARLIGSVTG